jgi:dipeptidyl aminopeptidase/acylaminoacyl peptidase
MKQSKSQYIFYSIILLMACGAFSACRTAPSLSQSNTQQPRARLESSSLPELVKPYKIEPGILLYKLSLPTKVTTNYLWVYLPEKPAQQKIPCIFIAPAGSRMFHGMAIGQGDQPEHLPYVRKGFAVVVYEVDGLLKDKASDSELIAAGAAFKQAEAGVANARDAIDYAVAKIPQIDSNQLYSAGHSSAATLSLLVAANEPRIKACIAYAPVCNVPNRLGSRLLGLLDSKILGFNKFIEETSPHNQVSKLHCPTFLFYAEDESVVSIKDLVDFSEMLKKTNPSVTLAHVPTGDHYNSMINEGIPQGINWLNTLKKST